MTGRGFVVLLFAVCVALYAAVLHGHFLCDDMAVIYVLSDWNDHGELWTRLFGKFSAGLDAPSNYYRPLAFLSYGINLALLGLDPLPWHLVNLAGHLAAGAAVYRISRALQPAAPSSRFGPGLAAGLFLLCGTNAEAVAWISGRYDVFATALSLWAAAHYLQSARALDRHALAALLCGVLAFTSKESAAILPGLIGCLAWIKHSGAPARARWTRIVRDLAPWLLLVAGYFTLRQLIFGSMFQVYPGSQPLARIVDGGWMAVVKGILPWLAAAIPDTSALNFAGMLSALFLIAGTMIVIRDRSLWRKAFGMLAAVLWSLALLLPHLSGLAANGEGGRLFYSTSALLAILIGVPFGSRLFHAAPKSIRSIVVTIGCALVIAHAVLLHVALRDWSIAGKQMGQLVARLAELNRSQDPAGYALVFAPDAIGAVPFARNANGAMVLPPVQRQPLLSNMIVFLPADIPNIPALLNHQLIPRLKRLPLSEAIAQMQTPPARDSDAPAVWPTDIYCWRPDTAALVKLPMEESWKNAARWESAITDALRRAGCGETTVNLFSKPA